MRELDVALQAAKVGGEIVSSYFRQGVGLGEQKYESQTYNRVSAADIESEQAIIRTIRETFPDHAVLAEESQQAATSAEHLWVIDPLDGTNNFLHGISHFAVSIAYYQAGNAMCGAVLNPVRDDLYIAERGGGAWHNGVRVKVNDEERLDQSIIGVGFYYDRGTRMEATLLAIRDLFRQNIHGIRRFGTASLDLAAVACGMFGAFFEYQQMPWDFAAGRLFVEEAGGRITTCTGGPLPLASTDLLASNGSLHEAMQRIVQQHLPTG